MDLQSDPPEEGAATAPQLRAASIFDGCGNLSAALQPYCAAYDIALHPVHNDVLSAQGQTHYNMLLSATRRGGLHWFGPPCCSWVFLSRSQSLRTHSRPQGNVCHPWVALHNRIADWVADAVLRCHKSGIYYVIEQPRSSLLWRYPAILAALERTGAVHASVCLGDFGGSSLKPLELRGTAPWLPQLSVQGCFENPEPATKKKKLTVVDKDGRVTGVPSALADSAAYPPEFCRAIAALQQQLEREQKSAGLARSPTDP